MTTTSDTPACRLPVPKSCGKQSWQSLPEGTSFKQYRLTPVEMASRKAPSSMRTQGKTATTLLSRTWEGRKEGGRCGVCGASRLAHQNGVECSVDCQFRGWWGLSERFDQSTLLFPQPSDFVSLLFSLS